MHESSKSALFDRIAAYVLAVVIGILPIFFVPFLGIGAELAKSYFVALGALAVLILWIIGRMVAGSVSFPKSPLLTSVLAIPIVFVISAFFSQAPHVSFGGLTLEIGTVVGISGAVILCIASALYLSTERRIKLVAVIALISTAVMTVFQLAYLVFGPKYLNLGNFFSSVSNVVGKWNDLAVWYGIVVLGLMLAFEFMQFSKWKKIASGLLLAFALFFLALVNFATVWGILALVSLVLFVYSLTILRGDGEERPHHFPLAPFIVLIVSLFFFLANPIAGTFLGSKFGAMQSEIRPSFTTTASVVFSSIKAHPLLGVGPDRFANAWALYRPASIVTTPYWDTTFGSGYGFVPTLFSTTGILGGLSMVMFLLLLTIAGLLHVFRTGYERRKHFYLLLSFLTALFAWIVACIYTPGIVGIVYAFAASGVFIGLLNASGRMEAREFNFLGDPRHSFFAILLLVILLLGSIYAVFAGGERFVSLALYTRAQAALNANDTVTAGNFLSKSIDLYPSDTYYRAATSLSLKNISALLADSQLSQDIVKSEFQNTFTGAETMARNAVAYDRTNPGNWINLESLYESVLSLGVAGAYDNAKAALDQVQKLSPVNPGIKLLQARLDIANKDEDAAKADLAAALAIKPNYIDAIFLLAQIEASSGDSSIAISQLESAALSNPRDATVYLELGLFKYDAKEYPGAVSALERSVTLDPTILNAQYFLALSYAKVGRTADARAIFVSLEKAFPTNTDLPKVIENIDAGRDPLDGFASNSSTAPLPDTTNETTTSQEQTSAQTTGTGTKIPKNVTTQKSSQ